MTEKEKRLKQTTVNAFIKLGFLNILDWIIIWEQKKYIIILHYYL